MTDDLPTDIPQTSVEEIIAETDDVSARVKDLMRKIDRLPPGMYELTIEKPGIRAMVWNIDIVRLERIESLRLSKYQPE